MPHVLTHVWKIKKKTDLTEEQNRKEISRDFGRQREG
jgi:hypothetical protein